MGPRMAWEKQPQLTAWRDGLEGRRHPTSITGRISSNAAAAGQFEQSVCFCTVPDQCETPRMEALRPGQRKFSLENLIAWRPEADRRQGDDLVGGRVGRLQLVRNMGPACPNVSQWCPSGVPV